MAGEHFTFTYHEVKERGFFYIMPWRPRDLTLGDGGFEMFDDVCSVLGGSS